MAMLVHQRVTTNSWKCTWIAADVLCPHLGFNLRPETVTPTTWQFQLPCDQMWSWNIRQRKMELGEETSNNKFWIFQTFRFWFQLNIAKFESWTSDPRKKGWWSYPYATHGAAIFTYKTGWLMLGKCWDSYSSTGWWWYSLLFSNRWSTPKKHKKTRNWCSLTSTWNLKIDLPSGKCLQKTMKHHHS